MELTHFDIRTAVRGAVFPASGDDLVAVARVNQAAPEVLETLDRLGAAEEFSSVEEILDELNLDHTAIDDTVQLRVALGMSDDATSPDDPRSVDEDPFDEDPFDDDLLDVADEGVAGVG